MGRASLNFSVQERVGGEEGVDGSASEDGEGVDASIPESEEGGVDASISEDGEEEVDASVRGDDTGAEGTKALM